MCVPSQILASLPASQPATPHQGAAAAAAVAGSLYLQKGPNTHTLKHTPYEKVLYHRIAAGGTPQGLPHQTHYFTGVEILDRCGNDPSAGSPTSS